MAVAFDAFTFAAAVDPSTTHVPVSDPRAALFLVSHLTAEPVTATYGGSSLTIVATEGSTGGEITTQSVTALFLDGVSSGIQTITVDSGASGCSLFAYTLTASTTVEFVNAVSMESNSIADPSTTLTISGRAAFVAEAWISGQDSTTGTGPLSNWTNRVESDNGTLISGSYSYDIVDTADVTVGSTQGADDWLMLAVAVAEAVSVGTVSRPPARRPFFGVGR